MKLRPEVEEALACKGAAWQAILDWHDAPAGKCGEEIERLDAALIALVELGVRLGLEAAVCAKCRWCADGYKPVVLVSPGELDAWIHQINKGPVLCFSGVIAEIKPADILQAQPEEETR